MSKISELMERRQRLLEAELGMGDEFSHSTSKGDVSELNWVRMMSEFLPPRYQVSRGSFIIDSRDSEISETSEQDIVIHDNYFHPQIFEAGRRKYIPAESVYAVFEVKKTLNKPHIEQAHEKATEVRSLHRTNRSITHVGGMKKDPREPLKIITGILADQSKYTDMESRILRELLVGASDEAFLDLGIAVDSGAFMQNRDDEAKPLEIEVGNRSLLFFLSHLYTLLMERGSVPGLDMLAYDRGDF